MIDDYSSLLKPIMNLAREAGEVIMDVYHQKDIGINIKADNTPVTKADLLANEVIVAGLRKLTPETPILSEEFAEIPFTERKQWSQYWLIDPLDGTKEFIERTGEFTVNIALIDQHQSVLGVVYAPNTDEGYEACLGCGAFKRAKEGTYEFINTRPYPQQQVTIAISRRHGKQAYDDLSRFGEYQLQYRGSALKICMVAEGSADIYPRLGKTSEWDTAAGHCILIEAGGRMIDFNGKELRYNTKPSTLNPEFIAVGDRQHNWLQYL